MVLVSHASHAIMGAPAFSVLGQLRRIRVQYGGGLILTILAPLLYRFDLSLAEHVSLATQRDSILAGVLAMTIGYVAVRRLASFPGGRAGAAVLPVMAVSYGAIALVFLLTRADYSRAALLVSFVVAVAWFTAVFFTISARHRFRFAVVPFGRALSLNAVRKADWYRLDRPALTQMRVDGIVADLRADMPAEWEAFIAEAAVRGLPVYHDKQIRETIEGRVEIDHLSENGFGSLIPNAVYARVKRACDLAALVLVVPVLLPLLAMVALAIRLDAWRSGDRGPVLFKQERMGFRGLPFTIWKFRTMIDAPVPADAAAAAMTQDRDPRITRVGHFLRRTRLDELPQAMNILRGEMSWIGPRPEAVPLSRLYESQLGFYRYRHIVRPGLTGWAQVTQGHVTSTDDVQTKLQYDFYYVKHLSAWLDIEICARTVRTILTGNGAR